MAASPPQVVSQDGCQLSITPTEKAPPTQTHSVKDVAVDENAVIEEDRYQVNWDGEADPLNPRNWTSKSRWGQLGLISLLNFVTCMSSSMIAPALSSLLSGFGSHNSALSSLTVSIYVVGFALAPMLVAPLSELYGRAIIYNVSNFLFLAFTAGCASSVNIGMFIAFRFLSGCAGITPAALLGGSIGDLMPAETMGKATALVATGSLIAPLIAPVVGGYLSEYAGWRWVLWLICILYGLVAIPALFFLRETYGPILLARKAKRLRKDTGDSSYRPALHSSMSPRQTIHAALKRPLQFLCTSKLVFILSLEVAIVYGVQYLVFTTLALVFEDRYQFSPGAAGLTYLGDGIGAIAGVLTMGLILDRIAKQEKEKTEKSSPETILWLLIPAGALVPVGLFWYGWSVHAKTFWLVPLIGLGVFGFAIMGIFMPVQVYLIRTFDHHSASALAANNLLRSMLGAVLPLAGLDMYASMGYGWGNSLLAFVALGIIPLTLLLVRYGSKMRARDRNIPSTK